MRAKRLTYNRKTIYVGVEMAYFTIQVISDYAVELMEEGIDDNLINRFAYWNIGLTLIIYRDYPEGRPLMDAFDK